MTTITLPAPEITYDREYEGSVQHYYKGDGWNMSLDLLDDDKAYITNLHVDEDARGQGIGKDVLKALFADGFYKLFAAPDGETSRGFWAHVGEEFEAIGDDEKDLDWYDQGFGFYSISYGTL